MKMEGTYNDPVGDKSRLYGCVVFDHVPTQTYEVPYNRKFIRNLVFFCS